MIIVPHVRAVDHCIDNHSHNYFFLHSDDLKSDTFGKKLDIGFSAHHITFSSMCEKVKLTSKSY